MIGFVYEWTNHVTGKKYIGAHVGTPNDGYIGSGIGFQAAWRKHGAEAFFRTILHREYVSEALLWAKERELIEAVGAVRSNEYYNQRDGGIGGRSSAAVRRRMSAAARRRPPISNTTRQKMSAASTGRQKSETTRLLLSMHARNRTPEQRERHAAAMKVRELSSDARRHMSESARARATGQTLSDEHRRRISASLVGRRHTPDSIARISESQAQRWSRRRSEGLARRMPDADLAAHGAEVRRLRKSVKVGGERLSALLPDHVRVSATALRAHESGKAAPSEVLVVEIERVLIQRGADLVAGQLASYFRLRAAS